MEIILYELVFNLDDGKIMYRGDKLGITMMLETKCFLDNMLKFRMLLFEQ